MFRRAILNFLLTLLLIIIMTYSFAAGENSMLSKADQPVLSIRINNNGCAAIASINDVPIMPDVPPELGGEMTIPINEWLADGENTVSVKITPLETAKKIVEMGQRCEATINLLVKKSVQPNSAYIMINKLHYISAADRILDSSANIIGSTKAGKYESSDHFKESEDGDIEISPIVIKSIEGKYGAGVELEQTINLSLTFPHWKWLTSDKIANSEETKKELIKEYHKIWQALHDKNISSLKDIFNERVNELNEAMYLKQTPQDLLSDFQKEINNHELNQGEDPASVSPKYLKLEIFGKDKLARIAAWDNGSIIFFNFKDGSASDGYDFIYRKEGDKWIITR